MWSRRQSTTTRTFWRIYLSPAKNYEGTFFQGGGSQLFAHLGDALPAGTYLYYCVKTSTTSALRKGSKAFSQLLSVMYPGIGVAGKFFDRCGKRTFNEVG